jgi:predicted nucleic acid-binding protein
MPKIRQRAVLVNGGPERKFMSDRAFLDTNVLVYAFDQGSPKKQEIAKSLINEHGSSGNLALSTQVLQEFYVVSTKKLAQPLSKEVAAEVVNDLAEFSLVQIDKGLIIKAMIRHRENEYSFWDCLIVEAALQSGCSLLLTEDMHSGRCINKLEIRNPF